MIDRHTSLVGLIGWPVAHSLSPLIHNTAFEKLDLNWRYLPLPARPEMLESAVLGLSALGLQGVNVTVPHKQAVLPLMDTSSPAVKTLGAVNTIVIERDPAGHTRLHGENTDHAGFINSLRQAGYDPAGGGTTLVAGAGGAARAIVYGLMAAKSGPIVVLNRNPERAERLVSDLEAALPDARNTLKAYPLTVDNLLDRAFDSRTTLLVNATTVGMMPASDQSIWPAGIPIPAHLTVFDAVYTPLKTRLLEQAHKSGATPIDGLNMLIQQAALAFKLWTKTETETNRIGALMRRACRPIVEKSC